jgi:bifunctional oligoribonuclease and PAP phosphatase NrnA
MTNHNEIMEGIAETLRIGIRFLITTHIDPDADGIGSMLGLGGSLMNQGKEVVMLTHEPVPAPLSFLPGADEIVQSFAKDDHFDAVLVLDCGDAERLGPHQDIVERQEKLICIDHHKTNEFFGDINLVDRESSSTGELVFQLIKLADFPIGIQVAKNLFAAIQTDTGSFRYENASANAFRIAAELVDLGAKPWEISRIVLEGYSLSRLKLLQKTLETLEFYQEGKIGMMTISSGMFDEAEARPIDSERFVDYPRFVSGVELSVLIKQMKDNGYKFSLRSNSHVDVAELAAHFGGGGHARAAGFESKGPLDILKRDFLKEAVQFFDGTSS